MPISSKTARDIHTELRINPINAVSVMSQYQNLSSDYSKEQQQRHLVTKTITKVQSCPQDYKLVGIAVKTANIELHST